LIFFFYSSLMEPQIKYVSYCSYTVNALGLKNLVDTLILISVQYQIVIKIDNFRRSKVAAFADQHQVDDETQTDNQQHNGFNFCNSRKQLIFRMFCLCTVDTLTHSYNTPVIIPQCLLGKD
jgi:hypothetical protein